MSGLYASEREKDKAYQWSFYFGGRPKHKRKQVEYRQPDEGWKQAQQGEHRAQSHIPARGLEKADPKALFLKTTQGAFIQITDDYLLYIHITGSHPRFLNQSLLGWV